ncbi:hypothetical protein [Microbacterium sp. 179-I 3D4 NHS]|uniref:hypothetical protein n=1 Tax=Microbacterium sp. 179-I 3D4 NHS TaxID=3142381 RepID=UPI0039A31269
MSNPEQLINSVSSQEPVILPEQEELVDNDDTTLPDDDVRPEGASDEPLDAGTNTDPDLGVADSPAEVEEEEGDE